jgi:hypothetical protein
LIHAILPDAHQVLLRKDDFNMHGEFEARRDPPTVVVTTDFAVGEFSQFLKTALPLELLSPIHVIEERA